jgi:hypothetical protein
MRRCLTCRGQLSLVSCPVATFLEFVSNISGPVRLNIPSQLSPGLTWHGGSSRRRELMHRDFYCIRICERFDWKGGNGFRGGSLQAHHTLHTSSLEYGMLWGTYVAEVGRMDGQILGAAVPRRYAPSALGCRGGAYHERCPVRHVAYQDAQCVSDRGAHARSPLQFVSGAYVRTGCRMIHAPIR